MRIYLPATTTELRGLLADGEVGAPPLTAFAVTPALREWYLDEELEEIEYAAFTEATRASLRLLEAEPAAARRRVVIALDAAEADVQVRDDLDRGVVRLNRPVAIADVAAVHVDDADAEPTVARAAQSVTAADLGQDSAQEDVDDAEGFELPWYANQEVADVLAEIDRRAGAG